ncbi:MAG: hypothetical protein MUC36_12670 [Planctomycetes bacterium]|jgi:hypothetical protein|nr:hypothetical protein [Planctomycetota bacterium]
MPHPFLRSALATTLVGSFCAAQCATIWQTGLGPAGTDLEVYATTVFDPDGSGPLPPRQVIGGRFQLAGATAASHIASLDPVTNRWEPLGNGLNDWVLALATLPTGQLVAGGTFNASGLQVVQGIAVWDGTGWTQLGSGTTGNVLALTVLPNGDLIAGGAFGDIGTNIARWNGTGWSNLGGGLSAAVLTLMPEGQGVVAGGAFPGGIQRWTGAAWVGLGSGVNGTVNDLTRLPNGNLVAGGSFTDAGGSPASRVAQWNGTSWSALGAGTDDEVEAVLALANGDLLVGGTFSTAGGIPASCVARWDGSSWSAPATSVPTGAPGYEPGPANVSVLALAAGGGVAVGGTFASIGGIGANNIARWNGGAWSAFTPGTSAPIEVLVTLPDGDVVAGGGFRAIDGIAANGIARWDGTTWLPFGAGVDGTVLAIEPLANGDLVIGGRFTQAGGLPASNIARWNGAAWLPLGAGTDDEVATLAEATNGDVIAGGRFTVPASGLARWNGSAWSALGGGVTGSVRTALTMPNGDLVVAGEFFSAGAVAARNIARWNGVGWSPLGAGLLPYAHTMMALPNGDLVVGGGLLISTLTQTVSGMALWSGGAWSVFAPLPGGSSVLNAVFSFARLPSGDLIAGGKVLPSVSGNRIARWNGSTWSYVVGITSSPLSTYDPAMALAPSRDGRLLVGGLFTRAGFTISAGLARLTTTCPSAVTGLGGGCPSSGGSNQLTAATLPWTGTSCRLRSTGLPVSSLVFAVFGFAPIALPLVTLFPQAGPGCVQTVAPDFVDVGQGLAGSFEYALPLPNTPSLAGVLLYHQHVPFEFDPQLQLLAVTATNALQLTIGTF